MKKSFNLGGFTLVELLLVIGIFAILATLTSINFFSTYSRTNLGAAKDVLIADLKTAQASAMAGEGQNGVATPGWGLVVNNDTSYTLFPGAVYDPSNPGNIVTILPDDIKVTTSFGSSRVIFSRGTGQIIGYVEGANTITLTGTNNSSTIRLNNYGTIIGD